MIELKSNKVNNTYNYVDSEVFSRITTDLEYDDFFREFMEANRPCIFPSSLTKNWIARKDWVDEDHTPDIEHFSCNFGSCKVPVAHCTKKQYNAQEKETVLMSDYIHYWKHRQSDKEQDKCLYLKDWHFTREYPDHCVYRTPQYFASDWLNEFWEGREDTQDNYRFVYLGPKGTWTPLHCDVFQSFSWSANVCGRKRWIFFPPGQEEKLKDKHGNLLYDVTKQEISDAVQYPHAKDAVAKGVEVLQEEGETIFVPSGWHHQVWNMEDTLSINHNWINATNLIRVWHNLHEALDQVEVAISDCRSMDGWEAQCQLILKSTHGMDFKEYYLFLHAIANRRLQAVNDGVDLVVLDGHKQGPAHTSYDLTVLHTAVQLLLDDPRLPLIDDFNQLTTHPTKLLDDVTQAL